MMTEEAVELEQEEEAKEMSSFNHSYICTEILLHLAQNKDYKPHFFQDITKYPEMPTLTIEIISASQNIQDLLDKAKLIVKHGVKAVWTVEPFGNTILSLPKTAKSVFTTNQSKAKTSK